MTRLGLLGALLVAGATLAIALVVAASGASSGPGPERPLLGPLLFTAPAVIGLAGAWRREPALLVAAGVLCLLQSVLAFSGVTIVYLPAALAFFLASSHGASDAPVPVQWSPFRVLTVVAFSAALVVLVIGFTGIYGVLAVVVVGGLARLLTAPRSSRPPLSAASGLLGILVVGLLIMGWIVANGWTREVCWVERESGGRTIREELPPGEQPPLLLGGDVVASGCSGGIPTEDGTVLSLGLAGLAVAAAAALPTGPRREPTPPA